MGWTGSLVGALHSTVNNTAADWVGYATERSTSKRHWFWHDCHNWLPRGGVWKAFRHAARYSRRLLAAIGEEMRARHVQCDEVTAPSVCAARSEWCVMDASWQPGHPVCGLDPATGEDLYRWDSRISPDQWDAVLRADEEDAARRGGGGGGSGAGAGEAGRLYHAIKW